MILGREGKRILLKMEMGEDFLQTLLQAMAKLGVKSGLVQGGIGALRDFELGWFDLQKKEYVRQVFSENHELLTVQGSLSIDAEPQFHLHATLADSEQRVVGGHLFRGVVAILAEVMVEPLEELQLSRELNPKTGLKELDLKGDEVTR